MEFMLDGQIHVLKFGYMRILVICQTFKIQLVAVINLQLSMKKEQVKNMIKQKNSYIRNYVTLETKKMQLKLPDKKEFNVLKRV